MCGFAGVPGGAGLSRHVLSAMAQCLEHRGPDDSDVWLDADSGIGFGHTRLSIIDLSAAGHQPMQSPTGRYVIAYNGEIYNHEDLRQSLERAGSAPRWRGHSDTETLLAGFDVFGIEKTITLCTGMFAFGVWDRSKRTLTLGRDRLGEKPLYYGWQGDAFLFGSELKALRTHPSFRAEIDRRALTAFMRHGYVPAPLSIYEGIRKLEPGTLLSVRSNDRSTRQSTYWSLVDVVRRGAAAPVTGDDTETLQQLEQTLNDAVRSQRIADVPLGAFLSGGIDSSLIVSLMQAQSETPVRTFTVGFHDPRYNEAEYAKKVAAHLGTAHTEVYVTPSEVMAVIPMLPRLYDEPFADPSQIPTHLISAIARRSVTVALTGDGGDELFYGYERYRHATLLNGLSPISKRFLAGSASILSPAQWNLLF